jgi:surface antigen
VFRQTSSCSALGHVAWVESVLADAEKIRVEGYDHGRDRYWTRTGGLGSLGGMFI